MSHDVRNSDDFRAGVAYAAHMLRHSAGTAHGASDDAARATIAAMEPRRCCQDAVLVFAQGTADGLEESAGWTLDVGHTHGGAS